MKFQKQALSIEEQISFLEKKGLLFEEKENAKYFLKRVSYFRLKGYFLYFQSNQKFTNNVSFKQIEDLYIFDQKLRLLLIEAIERIETTFCTTISNYMSVRYKSPHWFENETVFKRKTYKKEIVNQLTKDINNSHEVFIKEYLSKYNSPKTPPFWMISEIIPLGRMIYIYQALQNNDKKAILKQSLKTKFAISTNILDAIRILRNACSHHQRIYGKTFPTSLLLPNEIQNNFTDLRSYKSYIMITAYVLNNIGFTSTWNERLITLLQNTRLENSKEFEDIISFLKTL